MERRAQSAVEYIMMLAIVLAVVALATHILMDTARRAASLVDNETRQVVSAISSMGGG